MKIRVWSDLHIDGAAFAQGEACRKNPACKEETLVLAGDTSNSVNATIQYANSMASSFKYVVVVLGNHEFYKGMPYSTISSIAGLASQNVYILNKDSVLLDDVMFIGATLWTDFHNDPRVEAAAKQSINDFNLMYVNANEKVTPLWMRKKFKEEFEYIKTMVRDCYDKSVVVTHFPPLRRFQHPRWGSVNQNPLNAYFMTNNEEIYDWTFDAWICGHTHDPSYFSEVGQKFVCNPRGYAYRGKNENAEFDPDLILEI